MKVRSCLIACGLFVGLTSLGNAALVGSLRPVVQQNFQKLLKTKACPSCDLAGVVLNRIDLAGADLEGANLAGGKFFMTNLSGANLKNANLQGAALGGADLANADLRGANLTGAVLEGAYLKGALLDGRITEEPAEVNDELPDVSEEKYVEDVAKSKSMPYTQEAVVPVPPPEAVITPTQQVSDVATEAMPSFDQTGTKAVLKSKKIVPMADVSIPAAQPEQPVVASGQTAQADTTQMTGHSENTDPEKAVVEKDEKSTFWGAVTSLFSRDKKKDGQVAQKGGDTTVTETVKTPVRTGKDALPPDAGVMAMIEQIEGPARHPVAEKAKNATVEPAGRPGKPLLKTPAQASKALPAIKEDVAPSEPDPVPEKVTADVATPVKLADDHVNENKQITADQEEQISENVVTSPVSTVAAAGALIYGAATPQEAHARQQELIERLLDEDRCVECDLAGVDLSDKNLDEVDLERANLQGANLDDVDLSEANLKGVDFSGANLRNADLREADLYRAVFDGADLTGARLEGALVGSADFSAAKGVNLEGAVTE